MVDEQPQGRVPTRFPDEAALMRKRRRRNVRFRWYCLAAVGFAAAFILFFLVDLLYKGLPALRQAEIRVPVELSESTAANLDAPYPDDVQDFVSRAAKRALAREVLFAQIAVQLDRSGPEPVLQPLTITAADMPPWIRGFEETTIEPAILRQLVDPQQLAAPPSQADTDGNGDVWLRGSQALEDFLRESSGLDGAASEAAALLERARKATMYFDVERAGTEQRWMLADSYVDQYLKGYDYVDPANYEDPANAPLSPDQVERLEELRAAGDLRLSFNTWFFTNGDSKIPEFAGMWGAIVGSFYVLALLLVLCLPVGVLTSIYLEEFAPDNRLTQAIEANINNLAAIPSILFGVLGLAAFINFFGMPRSSVLVGAATLALMTLPIIIVSTRAALRAVPQSIRRAGFAMGATRWQVVLHHVLPVSLSGILTGSILGLAQAIGETAPLIIIGLVSFVPEAPLLPTDQATVMPAQIFSWWGMSLRAFQERAALAILVLLAVLFVMNGIAIYIRARAERRW